MGRIENKEETMTKRDLGRFPARLNEGMVEFQKANCAKGCRFADKPKVGTGEPCCTFCSTIDVEAGTCKTRR